jgi:hypothetical protein
VHWTRYCEALAGEIPAEALLPIDGDRLLVRLHGMGWTDVEIATHTRWSTYTVARIRDRLGLRPNQHKQQKGSAA